MFFLIKKFFQCILYFIEDLRLVFSYFPLKFVSNNSPNLFEQLSYESNDDHFPIKKPQIIKTDLTIPVHIPVPYKVPDRYKPLILPPILHDFPKKYYKYLPRFDGENGITAQKHIQGFENYLDLFEIDEDDVKIRLFSLSLQNRIKSWFKNLPNASISNFQQFIKLFLDRWIIKVNHFVIMEEYNQLKRHPNETIQQFSDRFNQVYYSMPENIRPPHDSALLHYPSAFDSEIEFRLRERDPKTLVQMQNIAVDVEVNLQIKHEKLKVEGEERKNIAEVKLNLLVRKLDEITQEITMKEEFFIQNHHEEIEEVDSHEQIPLNSNYHKSENEFTNQYEEEESVVLMCMFDDIPYFDDLPKYDHYDDSYVLQTQANFTEQSEASLEDEEMQFQQIEDSDQPIQISHESEEGRAENVEISEDSLPLCFASFQFIRENYHAINNQQSLGIVIDNKEDNETIDQDFSVSQLQLSVPIEINDQMTQESSIPLFFEPFQLLKEMWYNIFKEKNGKLVEVYEVPWNFICHRFQQFSQDFQDPIADMLNIEGIQSIPLLTNYDFQNQDDKGFNTQTLQSVGISSQILSESLQGDKDENNISDSWHGGHPEQMYSCLDQLNISVYILEDPFVQFLESTKEIKCFLILSFVDKFLIGCRSTILIINKKMQQNLSKYIMLEWLHWLFHFT